LILVVSAHIIRLTLRTHDISNSVRESFRAAFLAIVIAGNLIDDIVMTVRTAYFPFPAKQPSARFGKATTTHPAPTVPSAFATNSLLGLLIFPLHLEFVPLRPTLPASARDSRWQRAWVYPSDKTACVEDCRPGDKRILLHITSQLV